MTGYLISVLIALALTTFAVFAPRQTRLTSTLSFWLGMLVSELPLALVAWLALATGLAAIEGSLVTLPATIALMLMLPIAAGLVVILRRGLAARPALAAGLRDAGLPAAADAAAVPPPVRTTLLDLLAPFAVRVRGVRRIRNLRYGPHGRRNLLDVYVADGGEAGEASPVVVYAHGGGYFSGRKSKEARMLLTRLAIDGYLCVSVNYRLRPAVGFDGHLGDFAAAVRWVQANAERFGGDPRRLVLAGTSAGAHLATITGLSPELTRVAGEPGLARGDVRAVLGFAGYYGHYYGLDSRHQPSSHPIDHVDVDAPALFVVHGELDPYVTVALARRLVEALRTSAQRPVVLAELPGAHHVFDLFRTPRYRAVVDATRAFLREVAPIEEVRRREDASAGTGRGR